MSVLVDGATDEGPSHSEVRFLWTEIHYKTKQDAIFVTTRYSGGSYLMKLNFKMDASFEHMRICVYHPHCLEIHMTQRMAALTKKYTIKILIWLLKCTFIVATKHHLVQLLSICLKAREKLKKQNLKPSQEAAKTKALKRLANSTKR